MTQPLEARTIVEIRNIASGFGVDWTFGDSKTALIAKIDAHLQRDVPRPAIPEPLQVSDRSLALVPPRFVVSQAQIMDAMQPYIARGLRVRFPTDDTWQFDCAKKSDSGTVFAPMRDIINCAEAVLK
jgi:hypothetical protein